MGARGELDITIAPKISCKEKTITFHNPSFSKNEFTSASTVDKDVNVVVACTGYKAIGLDKWLDTPEPIESNPRLWFKKCFPPKMGNNSVLRICASSFWWNSSVLRNSGSLHCADPNRLFTFTSK